MGEAAPAFELVHHELRMRRLTVVEVERPTPRLARVVLDGADLAGFRTLAPDDHVKVFVPEEGVDLALPELGPQGLRRQPGVRCSPARDYTPTVDDGRLVLDVVLHGGGVASGWARRAAVGDEVGIAGPRGSFVPRGRWDRAVLVGDETALPAVRRWLQALDAATSVDVVVEVADSAEEQALDRRPRTSVTWRHRDPAPPVGALAQALAALDPGNDPARTLVWAAGEATAIHEVRRVALAGGVLPQHLRARGYWKAGSADHQEPHED